MVELINDKAVVRLKRPLDSVADGASQIHPWIFSGSVASVDGNPLPGDIVPMRDSKDRFVAWCAYSPDSGIPCRILTVHEQDRPTWAWHLARLDAAVKLREDLQAVDKADAARLVFSESDGLPGLVVDQYSEYAVLQASNPAMDRMKKSIAEHLMPLLGGAGILEKSDPEARKMEGLADSHGLLAGKAPDAPVRFDEGGYTFLADLSGGQKTGFYLDQRRNRAEVAAFIRPGMRVLDCFSYTGSFAVHAAAAGAAHVTLVDSSARSLERAKEHFELNNLKSVDVEYHLGDAFAGLRAFRDRARSFELVILDPPKLAPTKSHASKALRAYKDVNLLAMKLLAPGGILATFSCSAGVDAGSFREMISWAAADAGRTVMILSSLHQPPDHPRLVNMPESDYLKGFICLVR